MSDKEKFIYCRLADLDKQRNLEDVKLFQQGQLTRNKQQAVKHFFNNHSVEDFRKELTNWNETEILARVYHGNKRFGTSDKTGSY